jgi:hypothetical protein
MPAAFLLKILAIINLLGSGSRSGTEVAVPLVLEQIWEQRPHEREDIGANRWLAIGRVETILGN